VLGGAVAAWPLAARAQQPERVRRIGVLSPEGQARLTAFVQGLQQLGWTGGRNVRIDYRWGANDAVRGRRNAVELIALAPDVILASASPAVVALQEATRTVPIVFVQVVCSRRVLLSMTHKRHRANRYSITSSARISIDSGTSRSSSFAY
jgi:putative ABC transport system substrate-binding protein